MARSFVIVLVLALATACQATAPAQADRAYVGPRTAADENALPFSDAVQIGSTLYLSGQIGTDDNRRVPDTAEAEAVAVLDKVREVLTRAGMTMDDLVFVQVFCSDVSLYSDFNRVYRSYFRKEFPARAFIGSGPLLFGARFEVQGIAVKSGQRNVIKEAAMPIDQKINYLELPARDLDAIQRFYEGAFGWSFTDYGPEYRAFNDGFIDGGFRRADASSSTENGSALIVLYAENLEATRDTVVANGGTIVREIFSFPGGRRFHFADPNGNELAVWSDK